ncbi:kynureninase [Fimbriimonas ginsengisoli]|uniref:Kynureninase n=1 Tax=Fimbriimonas ginsengisoli Gsoil 348 TaxID=661478 RepID=A0A068NLV3_FIMGI|nr:kynureninase [Fimbriimonas ginsengisoli]AIE84397.1 kynureninase [Fimbriimonas ginsengisoli Gsoil 348]
MQGGQELDSGDSLSAFRDRFVIEDPNLIYLDGNSLGRLPKGTVEAVDRVMSQWGSSLVSGWREWYDLPQRLGAKIARLIGAEADEVVVCDSTSVNLFKLTVAALQVQADRPKVVTDDANFPSDVYVTVGAAVLTGKTEFDVVAVEDDVAAATSRIEAKLDGQTAVLTLSHALFRSGYVHDMARLTGGAHEVGALALWDLSHSVGALPIDLNHCGVDLAVGCTYKYVNGGPGAPAFLFVRRELQERMRTPIWGWFGQRNAFDFSLDYEPAAGVARFLAGTPPILSMAAVEPGIDLLLEAGLDRLREKSVAQTSFLIELVDEVLVPLGFQMITPRDVNRRGSHVSVTHPEAWRINQALIAEMKVIPDFRAPNVIRLGVTPLYTTFQELEEAIDRIRCVVTERRFEKYDVAKSAVT